MPTLINETSTPAEVRREIVMVLGHAPEAIAYASSVILGESAEDRIKLLEAIAFTHALAAIFQRWVADHDGGVFAED